MSIDKFDMFMYKTDILFITQKDRVTCMIRSLDLCIKDTNKAHCAVSADNNALAD